jgi:hypothetical protein
MDRHLAGSVAVVGVDWADWSVDGKLLEVGAAVAVELGVEVGEYAALEERAFAEVDAADDVSGLELEA